jgi:hypothetical protein
MSAQSSDPRRVQQVCRHIRVIKAGTYPQIVGSPDDRDGGYRIVERLWQDVPEASKLAILQDAVDWSGITNRDQAHILLTEIDPGRITDAQRGRLIEMAAETYQEMLEGKSMATARDGRDELER